MQILVSVADAADAAAAVDGGADIIDAKDPSRGPLGPVSSATLSAIVAAVAGRRPVSAALDSVRLGPLRGLAFVKMTTPAQITGCSLVLAAYADAPNWRQVIDVAAENGATGVLLDTRNKSGPGLFRLLSDDMISEWVQEAHMVGLVAALAGRLTAEDLPRAAALRADIAGVRGAACEGGRGGRVSAERVRGLIARRGISPIPAYP
jgi:uncharacterized protein (UPF0264 family)